ncbi:hypothetical protein LCGC14_2652310 [marine sediment metagenome]|uniref:Polymerase beta nucleotidyltransferase domain-containing protein n=1 Tax=marine sediment metagenome TaxID=412755 RepID=A0A0F8ZUI1_9ZZZZ|nr:nucleotidyltransferase domain-containing protein [Bacteroides sp.]
MIFGLRENDLTEIRIKLQQFPEVEEAFIYGSRAKGIQRKGSDVDLALKGKRLNSTVISQISYILNEETLMPFFFDVLNYHSLSNTELTDHINRVGKLLYKKSESVIENDPEVK